jgi:hypothetical protein
MFTPAGGEQLDPALLAFVKCHVTSPVKWELMRILANQNGEWVDGAQLVRKTHRQPRELSAALAELTADGVFELRAGAGPEETSYRLPDGEPTSIVLHRLLEATTHSLELRAIIAAQLQHVRQQTASFRTSPAVA